MALLPNYKKRKKLTITGSVDGVLTNYQKKITIYRSAGTDSDTAVYVGDECLSNYNDIRFTKNDGETLLDYWIESSDASSAVVWVEYDSVSASPSTTYFYMYYGYGAASAYSNGDNTFPFFDDFPGSSVDGTKWGWSSVDSVSGGIVTMVYAGVDKGISAATMFGTDYILRYYASLKQTSTHFVVGGLEDIDVWTKAASFHSGDSGHNYYESVTVAAGTQAANLGVSYTGYHIWEIKRNGTTNVLFLIDNSLKATHATQVPTGNLGAQFYVTGGTNFLYLDWVLVRKYTSNEPLITTWGAEEVNFTAYGEYVAKIDLWNLSAVAAQYPNICYVSGNIYANVSSRSGSNYWQVHTMEISPAGIITKSVIAAFTVDTDRLSSEDPPSIKKIANGVFAILYAMDTNATYPTGRHWYIKTVSISDDGTTIALIDTAGPGTEESVTSLGNPLVNVTGDIYIFPIRYATGGYTYLKLVSISIPSSGAMGSAIDWLTINIGAGNISVNGCHIVHATGDYCVMVYTHDLYGGAKGTELATFTVNSSGYFSAVISTLQVVAVSCTRLSIQLIYGTAWAVVYKDAGSGSSVSTFTVSATGVISSLITTLQFSTDIFDGAYAPWWHTNTHKWSIFFRKVYYLTCVTLEISDDGSTITLYDGPTVAYSSDSQPGNGVYIGTDYYLLASRAAATGTEIITLQVATNPAITGTGGLVRVTSLRHYYKPGVYTLEITTGDVTSLKKLPGVSASPKPDVIGVTEVRTPQPGEPGFIGPMPTPFIGPPYLGPTGQTVTIGPAPEPKPTLLNYLLGMAKSLWRRDFP